MAAPADYKQGTRTASLKPGTCVSTAQLPDAASGSNQVAGTVAASSSGAIHSTVPAVTLLLISHSAPKLRPSPAADIAIMPPKPVAPVDSANAAASLCTAAVRFTTALPTALTEVRAAAQCKAQVKQPPR